MSVLLGLDIGERRIGIALGDETTGQVRPLLTLNRTSPTRDAEALRRIAGEQGATVLVVGLPLSGDGTEGPQALRTREWAAGIAAGVGLPIAWRDERHTSQLAEQRLGTMGRGRSGGPPSVAARRAYRARVDREAACAILQAELDARAAAGAATSLTR